MMKIYRTEAPSALKERAKQWGHERAKKQHQSEKSTQGEWFRQHDNYKKPNLLADLIILTQHHCAYCDSIHFISTIDHFRPKTKHPFLVMCWANVFPCCSPCQGRGGKGEKLINCF
jgi:5-methylcytosine-specific restriction endonuclease McrA